jgi:phage host-nuclease inhibitor protein Gam
MATTARAKSPIKMPKTTAEVNELLAAYTTADARKREIQALIDQKTAEIRAQYADELDEQSKIMADNFDRIQMWAEGNEESFDNKRSIEFTHGRIGFRTGTPKLKLKVKTWSVVIERLRNYLPEYIRTTEEVAKDKLIADRNSEGMAANLKNCGLEVIQDETFYVEPKIEAQLSS